MFVGEAQETMSKMMLVVLLIIELLTVMIFQSSALVDDYETQDLSFIIQMKVTFSNPKNGSAAWNLTEEDRMISLFMNNSWQLVYLINCSHPFESVKTDEDGNQVAVLLFQKSKLMQGENISYVTAYRAISKPRLIPEIKEDASQSIYEVPADLSEQYCREVGPWLTNNSQLRQLAYDIAKNETRVLTIVKKLVEWITHNINYTVHEVPYYANETYIERKGDCDDQAVLLATLCRILGIPAYIQIGCIYLPAATYVSETYWEGHVTSVQKRIGWHGWTMVYVPPWGWLPVDLTYVTGGLGDPLSAIKHGAVTLQETIQYMNITQTDYVALSHASKELLIKNGFYIYTEDEMILETPKEPASNVQGLDPITAIIVPVATAATIMGTYIIFYTRKIKKQDQTTC
ncbi:MAG: transglutaminase-like domain-containing protein [Candidatus Bathyarchaeia archaeon]